MAGFLIYLSALLTVGGIAVRFSPSRSAFWALSRIFKPERSESKTKRFKQFEELTCKAKSRKLHVAKFHGITLFFRLTC